ncbi:MAG: hypothetical protein AB7S80_06265 [Rhizobiaceae bacterium]
MRRAFNGLIIAVATTASLASVTVQANAMTASREQVEAACRAQGGTSWGTGASSGQYGCVSDGGWIVCNPNGTCEGGRAKAIIRNMPRK